MISSGFERAPTIETERLILREQSPSDLDAACMLWSDPRVYRYIGGVVRSREDVWRRILANAGSWVLLGFGSWAVERKADRAYLGAVGLLDARRLLDPQFPDGSIEAGWAISPDAHGTGIASEAMTAVVGWSDIHLAGRLLTCMIAPENLASIRLAERLGFRAYSHTVYAGEETILFERTPRHD